MEHVQRSTCRHVLHGFELSPQDPGIRLHKSLSVPLSCFLHM